MTWMARSALAAVLLAAPPTGTVFAQTAHPEEIRNALAIWSRYGADAPNASPLILIDSISVHHFREEGARIAWKLADGRWTTRLVDEEGSGFLSLPTTKTDDKTRVLSGAEGARLDKLLTGAGLYRQPAPPANPHVGVGAQFNTMEVLTSKGSLVIRWTGRLRGPAGKVADILMGVEKN